MRRLATALFAASIAAVGSSGAGQAEISAAQRVIEAQLQAFQADDGARAYSYAAPGVKRIFPSVDAFMSMVESGYLPVRRPKRYSFGKAAEPSTTSIIQQVMIVGPDGRDYEAVYTLELQPDGIYRITGVSLRAANSLST
ncbi:MAG: hypothetical protein K0S21_261 [Rhizobiaceae bacterium]|jgi:hypothetical protein|nr:hypothetical protein [Rhizobiaceae bacterium]